MQMSITKEWFERRAALEGDLEIGAGRPSPSPSYNDCTCSCHRSPGMMHIVACCAPSEKDRELLRICEEINR